MSPGEPRSWQRAGVLTIVNALLLALMLLVSAPMLAIILFASAVAVAFIGTIVLAALSRWRSDQR